MLWLAVEFEIDTDQTMLLTSSYLFSGTGSQNIKVTPVSQFLD